MQAVSTAFSSSMPTRASQGWHRRHRNPPYTPGGQGTDYTGQLAGQVARTSASLAREYQAISRSSEQKAAAMRKLIMEEPTPNKRARAGIK